MDKKEQTRLRVQRYRDKQKSVTQEDDVTQPDVTLEMVPASYVEGIGGKMYEALPERARYLELSEVLDRLNQPTPNIRGDRAMQACNESAYNYRPNESSKERVKELLKGV